MAQVQTGDLEALLAGVAEIGALGIVRIPTPRTPWDADKVLGRRAVAQEVEGIGRLLSMALAPQPNAATFPMGVRATAPRDAGGEASRVIL